MTVTPDHLREILRYEPETGEFEWKIPKMGSPFGMRAGTTNSRGYRIISVNGRKYQAHRLAWLYMTGKFPDLILDHIDGDKINNRWSNLREATVSQNGGNCCRPRSNTSGYKGVCWHRRESKWHARIRVNKQTIHLGYFNDPLDAHQAYAAASLKHFGEFARVA